MSDLRYRFSIDGVDASAQKVSAFNKTLDATGKSFKQLSDEQRQFEGLLSGQSVAQVMGIRSASAGGDEFPIEKFADKFGASQRQMRQAMSELKPALADWKRGLAEGFKGMEWNFGHTDSRSAFAKMFPASVLKNLTFGINPLFNPTSVWGNLFATRQLFTAFSSKEGQPLQERILGGVGLGRMGGSTGGAIAATGVVMAALLAVAAGLKALTEVVKHTAQAFQDAHKLYSQALQSGMSLRLTSQMNAVGHVLGVDPSRAMAFSGSAEAQKQTQYASGIIANTAPVMAEVIMQFRILSLTLKAVFSVLGEKVAPPIRQMIDAFNKSAKMMLDSGLAEVIGKVAAQFLYLVNVLIKVASTLYGILSLAFAGITELFVNIKRLVMGEGVDFTRTLASLARLQSLFDTPNEIANEKLGMARQLPASAWEKMGLVIGGVGGGTDYAKRTANATERAANYLSTLAAIPRGATTGLNPAYPAP